MSDECQRRRAQVLGPRAASPETPFVSEEAAEFHLVEGAGHALRPSPARRPSPWGYASVPPLSRATVLGSTVMREAGKRPKSA
jgi:hypothetical protein